MLGWSHCEGTTEPTYGRGEERERGGGGEGGKRERGRGRGGGREGGREGKREYKVSCKGGGGRHRDTPLNF